MGIIVLAVALLPALGIGGQTIAKAETPGPTLDKLTPRISDTAKKLYKLYLLFTAIETLFLMLGGLNLYDALTTTLSSISTGGFSPYADSIAHFNSLYVEMIVIIFMLMGGTSFNLYYMAAIHGPKPFIKDAEFKTYISIITTATLLIGFDVWWQGANSLGVSFRQAIFQTSSIMTSSGFMSADYNMWPSLSKLIILLLMVGGGCSASTSGGLKVIRALIAVKLIRRGFTLGAIIVIAYIVRRMPYTLRSSASILRQMNPGIEEASMSLGYGSVPTFFNITMPVMTSGIISGAILSWITLIQELSSTLMLYSAKTATLSVSLFHQVSRGAYGVASALSTMLIVMVVGSMLLFFRLTGNADIDM